ncbi:MAG: Nif3-like dinuclear metal center hexameric protein [Actinomycetaceae bacterium]|nr:Nif3-like dinuclear metal center hexameric protein [Actinomycetaceae bacterium]
MTDLPTLADVVELLDELYPPHLAEDWDSVGLIAGDPRESVRRVLVALDPLECIGAEALEAGADLVITHHPLFLRGTSTVAATSGKGRLVHTLIRSGCALFNAHTNADAVAGGVADVLADLVGMSEERRPLKPASSDPRIGIGRLGRLQEPTTVRELAERLADAVPATPSGVRIGGDPERRVEVLAVCPGAGDSLLEDASRSGADAYITADLRHHPASEHLEAGGIPLITASHYATEWPWVPACAATLGEASRQRGWDLEVSYSTTCTEPWSTFIPASKGQS